ncbi:MAG: radical SAM protein [Candidatus Methanoperedens sp.]|nr:radical SAM protein [Candidatus Methanoperedens sp.]
MQKKVNDVSRVKIGLVQINNSFSHQNYLPYSIGILQAYAQKYLENKSMFEFLLPIYKRIPVKIAERELSDTDIIFFSTYIWNVKISLEIAKRIKQKSPETIIVFGGPQVPNKGNEEFLRKYPFIDIACHGEGEKTFLFILENYTTGNWGKVPSISYIDNKGKFVQTPIGMRISNLDEIPSPYIEGAFEPLMDANPKEKWIALWETNRGCPFSCSYCVWGSPDQKKVYAHNIEKIYQEIDWFSQHKIEFIFCCDANFGIMQRDIGIVKHFAENKKKYGYPVALSVQNTKNSTMRLYNIYQLMSDAGLSKGVSLALQSVNRDTLKSIKRENISVDTFQELQKKFSEENIETFTDIIMGLPCETYDSFVNGISTIIENGQHNRIQFINLSILTNSEMDELEYQKKYGFDIVDTKLINIHGSLSDADEIAETQRLVIGTNSMPRRDWARTRVFGWMTALLHFDKLLQIPFIILHKEYSIRYCELIENFITDDKTSSILSEMRSFFTDKARDIQIGGAEYCESKKWLNIWWPADELMLIKLCTENKLPEFYKEAEQSIAKFLEKKKVRDYRSILHDAIVLNQNLIKMPFQDKNIDIEMSYNIWDVYRASLSGRIAQIVKGEYHYEIDRTSVKWSSWEDWCREVVWYGNKKGAYLYTCKNLQ